MTKNEVRVSLKLHLIRDKDIVLLLERHNENKQGFIKSLLKKEAEHEITAR